MPNAVIDCRNQWLEVTGTGRSELATVHNKFMKIEYRLVICADAVDNLEFK